MSEISRFYGIVINMFLNEHNPPHFHAKYGEFHILVDIKNLSVLKGTFPPRLLRKGARVGIDPPGRIKKSLGSIEELSTSFKN